jgi:hypothetical protein
MYFFYVDEAGNRDPEIQGTNAKGEAITKDHIYVLAAVCLFEHRWHGFEKTLNRKKREYIDIIRRTHGTAFELADCEIKSNWIRIPKERNSRPFLSKLTDADITTLVDLYYAQLARHNMQIFSVIVDKRHLHDFMDAGKIHRKSWELLLEQIEDFMRELHPKHQGVLITDDVSKQLNQDLAMKHAYILEEGTASGTWLKHIAEMPLFVRSELSNGVQLADMMAYNIYRCFRYEDSAYPFFQRILPFIWTCPFTPDHQRDGLWIFPPASPLITFRNEIGKNKAGA